MKAEVTIHMDGRDRDIRRVTESELQAGWTEWRDAVRGDGVRVLVEYAGEPAIALISAHDQERLLRLEQQRKEEFRAFERISDAFKDVPVDELEREVARAIAEVRAEHSVDERQPNRAS